MLKLFKKLVREKNVSSLVTNVGVAFLGLVGFMLLARQLPKEAFGNWVLFITLATFTDLLRFGLTQNSVIRLLSDQNEKKLGKVMGSSYKINLWLLAIVACGCWAIYCLLLGLGIDINLGYTLFFLWYPVLALFNLGWNNAMALFQAKQQFGAMMTVRLLNTGIFVFFLIGNGLFFHLGLYPILGIYFVTNLLSSLWCTLKKWDGLLFLKHAEVGIGKELVNFGKYAMGTLVGSSLLKSADTLIIGLSATMGSAGVALYAIPLKLTDLLGIPLRSFTMTAYPRMSQKYLQGDIGGARKLFYTYTGAITLLFIPVALFCFVFAEYLILFLGGNEYQEALPLLVNIFRVFTVYTLLLPVDRFTGVLLDSINRPQLNLYKVIFMTLANVVIDLVAVFVFDSLVVVAVGTVLFTVLGIILGFYFLRKEIQLQGKMILPEGMGFFKNLKTHIAP